MKLLNTCELTQWAVNYTWQNWITVGKITAETWYVATQIRTCYSSTLFLANVDQTCNVLILVELVSFMLLSNCSLWSFLKFILTSFILTTKQVHPSSLTFFLLRCFANEGCSWLSISAWLSYFIGCSETFLIFQIMIRSIFLYLDRTYVLQNSSVLSLW